MKKSILYILMFCFAQVLFPQKAKTDSGKYPPFVTFTAQEDHDNMMKQLGISEVRPGPSGNESDPNHANYEESLANPCPKLPEILTTNNGKKVNTTDEWWKIRRPEIVEDLESEIYGRLIGLVNKGQPRKPEDWGALRA